MATVKLKVMIRTDLGKQGAKRTRTGGSVPAVLYGEQLDTRALSIDAHDLRVALSTPSGRNVILQLNLEGDEGTTRAVIREMDRDPVTREILHVDLQRISENKPVIMHVPVTLVGESPAVKEGRGILDHTMRQLEVRCLPRDIPENIEVDISALEAKHAIHDRDITVERLELLDNPERPVVEVLQPTIFREPAEVEAEAEAAEVAAEGEAPEEGEAAEAKPDEEAKSKGE
jgi:large subunit ribosomal protein L25